MADLDMVRRFAGADPDADTAVLQLCLNAAKQWYAAAGADGAGSGCHLPLFAVDGGCSVAGGLHAVVSFDHCFAPFECNH